MKAFMSNLEKYMRKKKFIVKIEKANIRAFKKVEGRRKAIEWKWIGKDKKWRYAYIYGISSKRIILKGRIMELVK